MLEGTTLQREAHDELAARADAFAVGLDRTGVQLDDAPRQGQANPEAAGGPVERLLGLNETQRGVLLRSTFAPVYSAFKVIEEAALQNNEFAIDAVMRSLFEMSAGLRRNFARFASLPEPVSP